ncbi:hypothetical protein K2D_31670 [Planctomycetes bacterium K2D]|nr:hypothetical protein K2D_31670 [Planctomycetes bacterium K2D]
MSRRMSPSKRGPCAKIDGCRQRSMKAMATGRRRDRKPAAPIGLKSKEAWRMLMPNQASSRTADGTNRGASLEIGCWA